LLIDKINPDPDDINDLLGVIEMKGLKSPAKKQNRKFWRQNQIVSWGFYGKVAPAETNISQLPGSPSLTNKAKTSKSVFEEFSSGRSGSLAHGIQ
jgi:hypothetical protein